MIVNQRGKVIFPPLVIYGMKNKQKISHGIKKVSRSRSRSISHGRTRKYTESKHKHTSFRAGSNIHPLGAKSKVANGGVAVGLPHRNYSVFKQAHINQCEVKERIRRELRIREVDIKAGARLKGSNGVVAVGLPHRNYYVFNQTPIN